MISFVDDEILLLISKYMYYPLPQYLRLVCKKLAKFFSPSSMLCRCHLTPPNNENTLKFAERVQLLLYARLWPVWELQKKIPFHRLANGVQHFVQGHVALIHLDGTIRDGTITGVVDASLKGKQYSVVCKVLDGVCQVPSCGCVTGYVLVMISLRF
jgi:hypothetical protein